MADLLCTAKARMPGDCMDYRYVAVGQEVYSFGSTGENLYLGVHVFNTVSLKWRKVFPPDNETCYKDNPDVPGVRFYFTAVLVGNVIYIWGGKERSGEVNNALYAFDVHTYTWINAEVSGNTFPGPRCEHSACVSGKVMYVHGGDTRDMRALNDVYKLDTSTMVWSLIKTRGAEPPPTSGHSATIIGTKMVVFGGHDNYNIRVFDTETNLWLTTPSAQLLTTIMARYCHSAFTYHGELYVMGREYDDDNVDSDNGLPITICDLWKINPETLSSTKIKPRGKYVPFWMYEESSCCLAGDRLVAFGHGDQGEYDSLYILDFNPSLQTLCKLAVLQYGLDQSGLPNCIREELAAMADHHTSSGAIPLN